MKIYTCRKRNEAGQVAKECVQYFFNPDINETCAREWGLTHEDDRFLPCIVRFGEVCSYFQKGITLK